MARRHRARFVALTALLADHPDVTDPVESIADGHVRVDGSVVTNVRARVRADAAIRVVRRAPLRGERKLGRALDAFAIAPAGLVAVDVGAAAGGFTRALLQRGARRVYSVDVGYGQLLGSLRRDDRVVNLERTNVAALGPEPVPEAVDLITLDVSYLSVAAAVAQLGGLAFNAGVQLVALVKPTFELHHTHVVTDPALVHAALVHAGDAIEAAGWSVVGITLPSVTGAGGAVEAFVHARRP